MLSRPPTRVELTQADVDEYNELREFAQEARADKRGKEAGDGGGKKFASAGAGTGAGNGGAGGNDGGAAAERRRRVGL